MFLFLFNNQNNFRWHWIRFENCSNLKNLQSLEYIGCNLQIGILKKSKIDTICWKECIMHSHFSPHMIHPLFGLSFPVKYEVSLESLSPTAPHANVKARFMMYQYLFTPKNEIIFRYDIFSVKTNFIVVLYSFILAHPIKESQKYSCFLNISCHFFF